PKIIKVDCHREIPGTDIDVLIETTEEIMIGQVKPYLSFDPSEKQSILNNFDLIEKYLSEVKKPFSKILFLMSREPSDSDVVFLKDVLPKEGGIVSLNGYIEEKESDFVLEYSRNHIQIIYLDEILEKLDSDGNYEGLIDQLKMIFIKKETIPFEKGSFLWD